MMHHAVRRMIALALPLTLAAPVVAQAQAHLRLATLAPENSPWHTALADMAAAWAKATSGRVSVTIFAGNSVDSESDAIDKMKPEVDRLQAATLTVSGLGQIDDAFNVFGVPFFFESDAELEFVQTALTPVLSARLETKGFHLVNWNNAGWIRLFSKAPIRTWEDARRAKLYTTEGDTRTLQWYTQNRFHAVPLAARDIPGELKRPTGAIDATPSPPYLALALQFYRDAPYMLDVRLAPLAGGTVIATRTWHTIALEDRLKMADLASAAGRKIQAGAPGLDADAIREMRDSTKAAAIPFQVIVLDHAETTRFRAEADVLASSQRGTVVPPEIFDAAVKERATFRHTH